MVAHRLETAVRYCDKILVLDQGQMKQIAHPLELLTNSPDSQEIDNEKSLFADMVRALSY